MLKTKDQVLEAFKELHAKVERETRQKLMSVQADHGGEYCDPFQSYCKLHGIRLDKTPLKTPKLNSLTERINQIIKERVLCMHCCAKLPKSFCEETMKIVVDIINISSLVPSDDAILEKFWSRKVSYNRLKVFGC